MFSLSSQLTAKRGAGETSTTESAQLQREREHKKWTEDKKGSRREKRKKKTLIYFWRTTCRQEMVCRREGE